MAAHSDVSTREIDRSRLLLKYRAVIQKIGPMVEDFLPHGILILFGASAPDELREVALVHDGTQLLADLVAGDLLAFSPPPSARQLPSWYRLTAVGTMANANLAELGHLVLHFDGATTAQLPGAVSVEPSLVALPPEGTTFELFGQEEPR